MKLILIVVTVFVVGCLLYVLITSSINRFKRSFIEQYEKMTKNKISAEWNEHIANLGERWRNLHIDDEATLKDWEEHIRNSADKMPTDISTVEFFKDLATEHIEKPAKMNGREFYIKTMENIEKITGLKNKDLYHFKPIIMLNSLEADRETAPIKTNAEVTEEEEDDETTEQLNNAIRSIRKQQYNTFYAPFAHEFPNKADRNYKNYLSWCEKNNNVPVSLSTFNKFR